MAWIASDGFLECAASRIRGVFLVTLLGLPVAQVDWLLARVVIYCGSRSIIVSMGWVIIVPVRELLCGVIECALHLFGPAARLES